MTATTPVQQETTTSFPIAEEFHSVQGEGTYTGTPMHFVRLAGCTVGKPPTQVQWETGMDNNFPVLKTGNPMWRCHTYDGRGFWCDTDFTRRLKRSFTDILKDTWENRICLTGGEPLAHKNVDDFVLHANQARKVVHVESSGTIYHDFKSYPCSIWLTISPKQGCLEEMIFLANEVKILIDPEFDINNLPGEVFRHNNVYIQPINEELSLNIDNVKRCYEILRYYPHWKISVQLHKVFNWR